MLSYVVAGYQTVLSWVFGTVSEQQDSQLVKVFIVGATGMDYSGQSNAYLTSDLQDMSEAPSLLSC